MQSIFWFIVVAILSCISFSAGCHFPTFLQLHSGSGPPIRRTWRRELREDGRRSQRITFHSRTMRSEELDSDGVALSGRLAADMQSPEDGQQTVDRSYQRQCLLEVTPRRFLCVHHRSYSKDREWVSGNGSGIEHRDVKNRYICMEFVQRAEGVVQMRVSPIIEYQDPRLCSDAQLDLDEWPLIDLQLDPIADGSDDASDEGSWSCYLPTGGYSAIVYDRRNHRGVCDEYDGQVRIESRCEPGDGLLFRFAFRNAFQKN